MEWLSAMDNITVRACNTVSIAEKKLLNCIYYIIQIDGIFLKERKRNEMHCNRFIKSNYIRYIIEYG